MIGIDDDIDGTTIPASNEFEDEEPVCISAYEVKLHPYEMELIRKEIEDDTEEFYLLRERMKDEVHRQVQ